MEISVSQMQGNVPVTVLKLDGQLDGQNYQDLITKAQELYKAGAFGESDRALSVKSIEGNLLLSTR